MWETLLEGAQQHLTQFVVTSFGQLHIVDTNQALCGIDNSITKRLRRDHTHRDMLLGEAAIFESSLQVHIVEEEVLVEILIVAYSRCCSLGNLLLDLSVQLLALALEHWRADMLRTQEEERRSEP